MTVKDWLVTMLILIIPVVNLIMLFVWAFGGGANPSKANYAKAALIWMVIAFVLYLIMTFLIVGLIGSSMKMK
nr:hypothetical protein [Paenibacillus elgii]